MNNSSLRSADSATHMKVVVVSLIAAIAVVGIGIYAKPNFSTGSDTFAQRFDATGPVIRAGTATTTAGGLGTIR